MSEPAKVLMIGHCMPDRFLLKRAVGKALPGADIVAVNDEKKLEAERPGSALLLVNRVLDGKFRTESGIDLIEALATDGDGALMLISNFEDAQQDAEAKGASPGVGKSDLHSEDSLRRIADAAQRAGA